MVIKIQYYLQFYSTDYINTQKGDYSVNIFEFLFFMF